MSTIQIRLLNSGCYGGGENVKFPVVVNAVVRYSDMFDVHYTELVRVGFNRRMFSKGESYPFTIDAECEVIS